MEFSHTNPTTVKYFNHPTQVKWFDGEHGRWESGIGVEDYIICACCGGVIPLDEFYDEVDYYNRDAEHPVENPIRALEWISLTDAIFGDEDYD